jgi:hypothetical protein
MTAFRLVAILLALQATATATPPLTAETRTAIEADWARQEQVARGLSCDDTKALTGALSRGRAMIADMRALGAATEADKAAAALGAVEKACDTGAEARALYMQARWALRELAFSNPAIDFDEVVFVKRQWPWCNHQCSHRVGEAQLPGANLCILKGLSPDGEIRELLGEAHARGGIGRFDLSYDATRIVFPYAAPRPIPTKYGYGKPGVRGGACIMYDIYEVAIDGSNLRQLTDSPSSEDTEPIYLPDGRIAFMTSRDDRYVQCGDWALACGMYSMAADGSDLRRITEPKEGEFYPNMLADGRIMYTRWDYVMKGYNVIQQLWAVNPDGRGASLLFGDHFAFSVGPIAFFEARQIPGTQKVICTGGAHHNTCAGPVMILDLEQNRGTRTAMVNITPEVGYPEINRNVFREVVYEELAGKGISNTRNGTGWYSSPYPLSQDLFLVAASFEPNNAAHNGYGLYLMDRHHNRELIYRFKDASCYSPMPLRPRRSPRVIPDMVKGLDPATPATLIVSDVYQGLPGVKRGEVKYLRVLETHSKTVRTRPQRCDIGVNSGWDIRGVLGTVPVEADGSARFRVPPYKQLFLEALDEDYLEIRRMRNFMNAMPGEKVSCVGCHEPPGTAPMQALPGTLLAMKRPPSAITPPPWGTDGLGFEAVVQPVLDKHCVRCHDGSGAKGRAFSLRSGETVSAPTGYDRDHAPHAQHLVSEAFMNLLKYVSYIRVGGYQGEKLPLSPNATGSRQSVLMKHLKKGHNNVELDLTEWRSLAAWIDCNAPYYGGWDEILLPETPSGPTRALRTQTARDKKRITDRIRQIEDAGQKEILAYLDCGLQLQSDGGTAQIRQLRGKGWMYAGTDVVKGIADGHRDIAFDESRIEFELSGLKKDGACELNMTWWDFNTDQRRQSVWVSRPDGSNRKCIRDASGLPAYLLRKERPEQVVLGLPAEAITGGKTRVAIQRDGGANAVIGEIWITRTR